MSRLPAFDLTGKTALVTGANTGIGQGIALALAEAGADIIAAGRSSMEESRALIAPIGVAFAEIIADLADSKVLDGVVADAWRLADKVDILVNNAGIIKRADAVDMTEADWDAVLDLNLKSPFLLAQSMARRVIAAGARAKIINVSSLLAFQGGIRVAGYTSSKHGLAGLTKLLANEWAPKGINVNAIAPGYVVSNNTIAIRADGERSAEILKRIPAGRWGLPSDMGGAAVFLAAPASDYVHGAVIPVDGGWLAR